MDRGVKRRQTHTLEEQSKMGTHPFSYIVLRIATIVNVAEPFSLSRLINIVEYRVYVTRDAS